jgi:hypothetical protein
MHRGGGAQTTLPGVAGHKVQAWRPRRRYCLAGDVAGLPGNPNVALPARLRPLGDITTPLLFAASRSHFAAVPVRPFAGASPLRAAVVRNCLFLPGASTPSQELLLLLSLTPLRFPRMSLLCASLEGRPFRCGVSSDFSQAFRQASR